MTIVQIDNTTFLNELKLKKDNPEELLIFMNDYLLVDRLFEVFYIYGFHYIYQRKENNTIVKKIFLKGISDYLEEDDIDYSKVVINDETNTRRINKLIEDCIQREHDSSEVDDILMNLEDLIDEIPTNGWQIYKIMRLKDKLDLL